MSIRSLAAAVLVSAFGVGVMGCGPEASDGDEVDGNTPEGESVGTSQEALTWYHYTRCDSPGGWGEPICVAWTGGYPSGYARAESRSNYYYAISLRTCSNGNKHACDATTTVASKTLNNTAGYTPSVRVGKYSWYIVCAKRFSSSGWACNRGANEVYLGD
jgi:hypothetical protein